MDFMATCREMERSREEKALEKLVGETFLKHSLDAESQREKLIAHTITQGKIPENGWGQSTLAYFIHKLACLDTNNFVDNVGVGEREGRVFSTIVSTRHYRMSHGIGRSGNLYELQPKAMGSSILYTLCNRLVCHAINLCGMTSIKKCLVLPVATGMAITLCLLTLRRLKPQAKFVLWCRIDQKSCFKCILTAGYIPVVIELVLNGDQLHTNISQIVEQIEKLGSENILCVISTTSCFAPRTPDDVETMADLCHKHGLYHVVNNAYGLQNSRVVHQINKAILKTNSEVTFVVQSTDKNFLVPVGGSVVFSKHNKNHTNIYNNIKNNNNNDENSLLDLLAKNYPGRASGAPIFDLCVTLLEMGQKTWLRLLKDRKDCFQYMLEKLNEIEKQYCHTIKILPIPKNGISVAITIADWSNEKGDSLLWKIAEKLYYKHVSGARFVKCGKQFSIDTFCFKNWGQHNDNYPHREYIALAVSIGMNRHHVDEFISKFDAILKNLKHHQ